MMATWTFSAFLYLIFRIETFRRTRFLGFWSYLVFDSLLLLFHYLVLLIYLFLMFILLAMSITSFLHKILINLTFHVGCSFLVKGRLVVLFSTWIDHILNLIQLIIYVFVWIIFFIKWRLSWSLMQFMKDLYLLVWRKMIELIIVKVSEVINNSLVS